MKNPVQIRCSNCNRLHIEAEEAPRVYLFRCHRCRFWNGPGEVAEESKEDALDSLRDMLEH